MAYNRAKVIGMMLSCVHPREKVMMSSTHWEVQIIIELMISTCPDSRVCWGGGGLFWFLNSQPSQLSILYEDNPNPFQYVANEEDFVTATPSFLLINSDQEDDEDLDIENWSFFLRYYIYV